MLKPPSIQPSQVTIRITSPIISPPHLSNFVSQFSVLPAMASSKSLQSQEPTILFCDTEARIRQLLENDPDVDLSEEERAEVVRDGVVRV